MSGNFDEANIEKVARCMKALAHPLRLKVIVALNDQELSVQELVEAVGTTQSNVSQHLTIMRDKQILSSRRDANQVFYRVGDCKVLDLVSLTRNIFCNATHSEN
ncbi:ArsR/SmtB family transcription factor [Candidatus Magnetaquicoccus inordinatus]|uniref:ArsR/SmtB family transcription factor n=1 Tax=Candidatus Magnetaquicoccus inordinatus TaxID=2496818 RepID=UPI001D0F39CD|nr:metalloregulator ArsR/SmtB family transcription factor [Candidatus Magnetaquicoccus inordinatus]